ncbi:MAG TPA: hypothetical protein VFU21_30885 [Kofleriaceae bacterium]|nr:hypothetical protein [Kofleriaceae bacterium]
MVGWVRGWVVVMLVVGCGGDDDGGSGPLDAAARADAQRDDDAGIEVPDAAAPLDAAVSECPELEPGAGDGFANCNPLRQTGCQAGEKCAWLVLQEDPFLGVTDCVPDGTVEIGGECAEGPPGETTGYDDCAAGGDCIGGRCHAICTLDADSCCEGFACSEYASVFNDDDTFNTGVCDQRCDPVAQDCAFEGEGCYLRLFDGVATCSRPAAGAEDRTQGDPCVSSGGSTCFLNGCAEGYGGFLFTASAQPRDCTAFCTPVDTYLVDPDGDGTGSLVTGADADGAAPADCSEARIGIANHQCRFFQSFFIDMNGAWIDYVPDAYGFCAPRNATFGNCNRFSEEWFLESYNDYIEGGGFPAGWSGQLAALCEATPARCAAGCARVATLEALDAAYCAVPANATRPSCIDGLVTARRIRQSVERYWKATGSR